MNMKKINQLPALIGFGLGCIIIFISWLIGTVLTTAFNLFKISEVQLSSQSYQLRQKEKNTSSFAFLSDKRNF